MPEPFKPSFLYIIYQVIRPGAWAGLFMGVFAGEPAEKARIGAVQHGRNSLVEMPCLAAIG